jgi:hypothetical protein
MIEPGGLWLLEYGGSFDVHDQGVDMGMARKLIKGAVVAKVLQVAQRELSKPENQRKIKEGIAKLRKRG